MKRTIEAGGAWSPPAFLTGALATLLLASCGQSDDDPGPGGVTVGEARTLDEAAEMLDAQRLPDPAVKSDGTTAQPAPAELPSPAR